MVAALLVAARVSIPALSLLSMVSGQIPTNHPHQSSTAAASLLLMGTTVVATLVATVIPALLLRRPILSLSLVLVLVLAALLSTSQETACHPS